MSQLNYLMKVPNTERGRVFLSTFRSYINTESYSVKIRGRKRNRIIFGLSRTNDVPHYLADYFSVYLKAKIGKSPVTVGIDSVGNSIKKFFVKRAGYWVKK